MLVITCSEPATNLPDRDGPAHMGISATKPVAHSQKFDTLRCQNSLCIKNKDLRLLGGWSSMLLCNPLVLWPRTKLHPHNMIMPVVHAGQPEKAELSYHGFFAAQPK